MISVELSVLVISADVLGEQIYRAQHGRVYVNNTKGVGIGRESNIKFEIDHPDGRALTADVNFTTRKCHPGELEMDIECLRCPIDQYSFDPSSTCRDCDQYAHCSGGASFAPMDGYWHSTPFSPQFHECTIRQACAYEGRREILEAYYQDPGVIADDLEVLEAYMQGKGTQPVYADYKQCADGYVGVLCGSCDRGYAHLEGGECVKCPTTRFESVVRVMFSLALAFVLFLFNVFSTLDSAVDQIMASGMIDPDDRRSRIGSHRNLRPRKHADGNLPTNGELESDRSSAPASNSELHTLHKAMPTVLFLFYSNLLLSDDERSSLCKNRERKQVRPREAQRDSKGHGSPLFGLLLAQWRCASSDSDKLFASVHCSLEYQCAVVIIP